jgi:hypothetical protein
MTTAPGKFSAIGAGPSVVADAHLDTAAAPLSDLRCRWTAAVTPFDVAVDYMRAHAGSCRLQDSIETADLLLHPFVTAASRLFRALIGL